MKTFYAALLGSVLGAILVAWWFKGHPPQAKPAEEEHEAARETGFKVHRGTNGVLTLSLPAETRERLGIQLAPVSEHSMAREIRGYGRVLDATPFISIASEIQMAQTAFEASQKEFERLRVLRGQDQNASARALEAAEAIMKRDRALIDLSRLRLVSGWGQALSERSDLTALAGQIARQEKALALVGLPLGQSIPGAPSSARIAPLGDESAALHTESLGMAPGVDPQTQGSSFLFLIHTNLLRPGAPLVGWLGVPGDTHSAVAVPTSALVYQDGGVFVYVLASDNEFTRAAVDLDRPFESGWLLRDGLKPGARVVGVGAQQLLSEELKGKGGEE